MRVEVLDYLNSLKLKNYKVAKEVPFSTNGTVLYLKNPKTIYVEKDQVLTEPYLQLMDELIEKETYVVVVYLATDAKQLPTDYATVVSQIENARGIDKIGKFTSTTSNSSTEFEEDLLVTKIELTFESINN